MRSKPNTTVFAYTSFDPTLTTDVVKTLIFGRDDMGRGGELVLKSVEQIPGQ